MNWKIEQAKNGQNTLKLNNIYIYSKYNPENEVEQFMKNEVDLLKNKFIVVGVGLGYHLKYLIEHIENVEIRYLLLDEQEKNICDQRILNHPAVKKFFQDPIFNNMAQIIIPQSFLTAIGREHPLFDLIEDIKIRQVSYNRFKFQMKENFEHNINLFNPIFKQKLKKKKAVLISSGPSLNQTLSWLKKNKQLFDIYCVGSALKIVLNEGIKPLKVFMSDPQDSMINQIPDEYQGELVFLSTANYKAVSLFKGKKQIIFQVDYKKSEEFAKQNNQPLFSTGGSVATLAFSYIKWIGYEELYLFGQDLGFDGETTHAKGSTSLRHLEHTNNLIQTLNYKGQSIYTTPNLLVYKRWFEKEISKTSMKVFNTAITGVKIKGSILFDIKSL